MAQLALFHLAGAFLFVAGFAAVAHASVRLPERPRDVAPPSRS